MSRSQREAEAHRHWELPILATRTPTRLPYATFLPWDEAIPMLMPFVHNADPDIRKVALHSLIAAVRYQRSHAGDALALILARKNEQDPIRLSMLSALTELPPGLWQTVHLDSLGKIIRDALYGLTTRPAFKSFPGAGWWSVPLPG